MWTREEYLELYLEASEILRRREDVEVMGPAVIDFELQVVLALVDRRTPGLRFDIVSSLLYVDRAGAPENRHLGMDLPLVENRQQVMQGDAVSHGDEAEPERQAPEHRRAQE